MFSQSPVNQSKRSVVCRTVADDCDDLDLKLSRAWLRIAIAGVFAGQGDVFYEVVAIVIAIYTFGRMLGERSQARLKLESDWLRERFNRAVVREASGQWVERPIAEVSAGARVRVEPGAAFTVDGMIIEGVGYVEETALTGEPLPVV